MRTIQRRLPLAILFLLLLAIIAILSISCTQHQKTNVNSNTITIKESEVVNFQKEFQISYNAIIQGKANNEDITRLTTNHIEDHYGFDMGKVMFKAGNRIDSPFRSTYEGLLSYYIGNNALFDDEGIVNSNFRIIDFKNEGIINDDGFAVAMGQMSFENDKNRKRTENYTMILKKDDSGTLKMISHKIAEPTK